MTVNEMMSEEDGARMKACEEYLDKNLLDENRIIKNNAAEQIEQEKLKKYIIYARRYVHPKLNEIDKEKVT